MTATTPPTVRFIMHVGPGIGLSIDGMKLNGARERLSAMMRRASETVAPGREHHVVMALPDALTAPRKATLDVMTRFKDAAFDDTAVFSVAINSHSVVNSLLNCIVDAGLGDALVMCLHYEDPSQPFTTHRLDHEGQLSDDWPFGVLNSEVESYELRELGFTVSR